MGSSSAYRCVASSPIHQAPLMGVQAMLDTTSVSLEASRSLQGHQGHNHGALSEFLRDAEKLERWATEGGNKSDQEAGVTLSTAHNPVPVLIGF